MFRFRPKTKPGSSSKKYMCRAEIVYHSTRYSKTVIVPKGYLSDGASGPAIDIWSKSWWVHDVLCERGTWEDKTRCTNWQASVVLGDILRDEGRHVRAVAWKWATFIFGGGAARKNGMIRLKQ